MIHAPDRGIVLASGVALIMHLLLFAAIQPSNGKTGGVYADAPRTRYLMASTGASDGDNSEVRLVRSPVVFSLPSIMGFSRDLQENDVRTKLSFLQPVKTEHFLENEAVFRSPDEHLAPLDQRISAMERRPGLPAGRSREEPSRLIATRVVLAPELKARLLGGIVLPPDLNKAVETPWEVHASISVSEQGAVAHVLLEDPIALPGLNQQVLQLLYGLRFKAGPPLEGSIEIYSPENEVKVAP